MQRPVGVSLGCQTVQHSTTPHCVLVRNKISLESTLVFIIEHTLQGPTSRARVRALFAERYGRVAPLVIVWLSRTSQHLAPFMAWVLDALLRETNTTCVLDPALEGLTQTCEACLPTRIRSAKRSDLREIVAEGVYYHGEIGRMPAGLVREMASCSRAVFPTILDRVKDVVTSRRAHLRRFAIIFDA